MLRTLIERIKKNEENVQIIDSHRKFANYYTTKNPPLEHKNIFFSLNDSPIILKPFLNQLHIRTHSVEWNYFLDFPNMFNGQQELFCNSRNLIFENGRTCCLLYLYMIYTKEMFMHGLINIGFL